jgi:hypothetical protein
MAILCGRRCIGKERVLQPCLPDATDTRIKPNFYAQTGILPYA